MSRASILTVAALAFSLAGPAAAHDFWIQPDAFHLQPGRPTPITLQLGHGAERQRSLIPLGRITQFSATGPNGSTIDLKPDLRLGGERADGEFSLPAPGVYVLALVTDNRARSRLPAARFDAYLKEEGMISALEARARAGPTGADVSERYSRVAKAIVQVGGAGERAAEARALGLPLEIVPEVSPYAEPRPRTLSVRVLREGRPLAGALVKLTDLEHDEAPTAAVVTDAMGRASFPMPERGNWLLNLVSTTPLAPTEDADFETVFSSLSFGFSPSPP